MSSYEQEDPDIWSSAVGLDLACSWTLMCSFALTLHMQPFRIAMLVVQAHHKIPEDAWEYHTRKALNDAAFKELQYVPYSSTMPVQAKTDEPKFMWVSRCNVKLA